MQLSSVILSNAELVYQDEGAKSISYFCKKKPVKIDKRLIEELKGITTESKDKNVRICLHENPDAIFHDMIILEHKDKYYRPHKHLNKGETFHIMDGSMAVFIFDENGTAIDSCVLDSTNNIIYRVGINMYHAVMPMTDLVIYHESKPGPFLGGQDSIFPSWAPKVNDSEGILKYKDTLLKTLRVK